MTIKIKIDLRDKKSSNLVQYDEMFYKNLSNKTINPSYWDNLAKSCGYKNYTEFIDDWIKKKKELYKRKKEKEYSGSKNKQCSLYLGVYVAENLLKKIFNDVKRAKFQHGYDFICGNVYKIDVKSSCKSRYLYNKERWQFNIKSNKECDYFLMIGFDDRKTFNIEHVWLIAGNELVNNIKVNERDTIVIINTDKNLEKYKKYELIDVNRVCETIWNEKLSHK